MAFPLFLLAAASAPLTPAQAEVAHMIYRKSMTLAEIEAEAAQIHARMDLDHDGFVTRDELMKVGNARHGQPPAPGDPHAPVPPLVQAMFDAADTDHDGRISAEESKAGADREFYADDVDHDGVVTPEERMAAGMRFAHAHADAVAATWKKSSK